MQEIKLLSIVIPVYNASLTISSLVERLFVLLGSHSLQIVLVNDASLDKSHQVCSELALRHAGKVMYLNLARNFGEHNAVMAGLNYAEGDYVIIMDDDFQNPPEEVLKLFNEALNKQYDIVYACYEKKQDGWLRNLGSKFNNWVANFMLEKPKDLYLSSFKCFSQLVVREVIKYKGPFPYIDGLALRCTNKISSVEVEHHLRKKGRSGYTLRKLIRLWLNMFVNFSIVPLRISFFLGLIFSCLGVIFSIYTVIEKLLNPQIPLGWPTLIIVVMVFSGVQLLILGLVGEYLGHLLLSHNSKPQFVIRDIINHQEHK